MKDGTSILQNNNGIDHSFNDLDKDLIEKFELIDSAQSLVTLDLASGNFSLNNLDLTKLNELEGNETVQLKYDSDSQSFKMSSDSLEFLNTLILKEERTNHIGFDQTGVFNLNGILFHMGFKQDEEMHEFKNKPPYKDIIQYNNAITDFTGSKNNSNPYKRFDAVLLHTIGYLKEYSFNSITLKLSLLLTYDVIQKCVSVNCTITSNETLTGKLYLFFGNNESFLDVTLYKNEPANLSRIITMM